MPGFLLVRGGVHIVAYAKALEELSGVDVKKMLPIPNIPDADFKEARELIDKGMHGKLYRFSETDFDGIRQVWTGTHPLDGTPLQVIDGLPETAGGPADPPEEPAVSSPACTPVRSPRSFRGWSPRCDPGARTNLRVQADGALAMGGPPVTPRRAGRRRRRRR